MQDRMDGLEPDENAVGRTPAEEQDFGQLARNEANPGHCLWKLLIGMGPVPIGAAWM